MKKNLVAWALFLCLVSLYAFANTTYYNFSLPVVGGSQNTWGSLSNAVFTGIDTQLWDNVGGVTVGLNSVTTGSTVALPTPVTSINQIAMTTTGKNVDLPAMNQTKSPVVGGTIYIANTGSNAFAIMDADNSTSVLSSLPAGESVYVQALTNSTTDGSWALYGPYLGSIGTISLGSSASLNDPSNSGTATTGLNSTTSANVNVAIQSSNVGVFTSAGLAVTGVSTASQALELSATHAAPAAGTPGIYSSVAGALDFSTTGASALHITTSGSVGIGTTTPSSVLTVGGTFNTTGVATLDGIAMPSSATSGGIPYYSSTSAQASSGALTQYGVVLGGGAGNPPTTLANGTAGYALTATATAPTWTQVSVFGSQNVVTGSRSANVVYHNTTGKTMFVTLSFTYSAGTTYIYSDSSSSPSTIIVSPVGNGSSTYQTVSFMVLNGNYYELYNTSSSGAVQAWVEWY